MTSPGMTGPDLTSDDGLGFASAVVRAWTYTYTWRLEPAIRDRRRAEIESELWEFQHDPERGNYAALHQITRLLIGIPDDLSWRAESKPARHTTLRAGIRVAAWTVATVVVFAALWILPLLRAQALPPLPDKPRVVMKALPPPPPPPPPPCAPAGSPQFRPCTP